MVRYIAPRGLRTTKVQFPSPFSHLNCHPGCIAKHDSGGQMRRKDRTRAIKVRFIAAITAALPLVAYGQAAPPAPAEDTQWKQQMESRMQQLERENAELRDRVGKVAETQQAVMKD